MLDLRLIRQQPEAVAAGLRRRGDYDLGDLLRLDEDLRKLQVEVDNLRQQRNQMSENIGAMKKKGQDVGVLPQEVKLVGEQIKAREEQMAMVEAQRQDILLRLPNLLDASVPDGKDETGNVEVRRWGQPRAFDFKIRAHWELGEALGILDTERAVKLAKTRFVMMRGAGATLERALVNFMLDLHIGEHGYTEAWPPAIVNKATMTANGNLPKFAEDLFQLADPDLFLIPTAEVPLTSMHRDEILAAEDLPINLTAFTPCFRSEAGSAGKDTRGMIRVHQFSKVELVKVVKPEDSPAEQEKMLKDAEKVLELLGLPYRVVLLCSGDTSGFSSSKTYDLEVWFPAQGVYREISSVSNCTDFQSRRGNLRYRPSPTGKLEHPHTLNGSGVAVGRALAAILENYQQADGSVDIPPVLRPYMRGLERITV